MASLFDERNWKRWAPEDLVRPHTLPRPLGVKNGIPYFAMSAFDARQHASGALADFGQVEEEEGEIGLRWRRNPGASFRIPHYRHTVDNDAGYTPDSCLPVPEEPRVHDEMRRLVQIRLPRPNSETGSRRRQTTSTGARLTSLGRDRAWQLSNLTTHAMLGGVDLRTITGNGMRGAVARGLQVSKRHVKLHLEVDEGGREGEELGPCMLSAYARESETGLLALRVSLDPDSESPRPDCTLSCSSLDDDLVASREIEEPRLVGHGLLTCHDG